MAKHYIKLRSLVLLEKPVLKEFYNIIREVASSVIELNDAGKPYEHRIDDSYHIYCIYLSRDLSEDEIEELTELVEQHNLKNLWIDISRSAQVAHTTKILPDLFSTTKTTTPKESAADIDWDKISEELAKHNHDIWMQTKLAHGWKWSTKFDLDNKLHPLLKPWEQLPEEYRQIDPTLRTVLTDLLDDMNLQIVNKD